MPADGRVNPAASAGAPKETQSFRNVLRDMADTEGLLATEGTVKK
jgi:hypothetical protein